MSSKSDFEAYDDLLMQTLSFSSKDLDANRDGVLTKAQKKRLRNGQLVWSVPLWGVVLLFVLGLSETINGAPRLLLLILPVLLVAGLFWHQRHFSEMLKDAKVMAVRGRLKGSRSILPHDRRTQWIEVLNERFFVGGYVYDAFIEGDLYTLYYLPENGKAILSAERHSEPQARRIKNIQKR